MLFLVIKKTARIVVPMYVFVYKYLFSQRMTLRVFLKAGMNCGTGNANTYAREHGVHILESYDSYLLLLTTYLHPFLHAELS